jgi:hypothetical protein
VNEHHVRMALPTFSVTVSYLKINYSRLWLLRHERELILLVVIIECCSNQGVERYINSEKLISTTEYLTL